MHTENNHLCQIITTFTTGLTALNGLTAQVQNFATGTTGTDFNISSATATHTFNLPTASGTNRGALSSTDWTTFNNKENAITAGTTAQYFRGDKTFQTLNTSVVPEGTNLYYTEARVNANTNVAANTAARHNAVTLGTANGLSLSTQVLSLGLASAGVTGALSGTDWSTFNNKQNALTNPVTGTGTTNYLVKFTGSTTVGNSQVFDNGTNVLIGTTTDAGFKLDVNGTGRFGGIITTTSSGIASGNFGGNSASWEGNAGYPTLFGSSADRWIMHINPHISYTQNGVNGFAGSMTGATLRYASNPSASYYWDIGVGTNSVGADKMSLGRAGVNFLAITNAGNIGIGTATPAMSLQIGNGSLTGNQYLRLFNSASDIYLGQTGSNLFGAGNGQVLVSDATYTSNFAIGTLNGSANLIFGTSNIERMRITSGGNVGIGTTSPNSIFGYNILTINNSTFGGLIDFANNNTLQGRIGADQGGVYLQAKTNIPMSFSTNDTERMRITSGGAILINRTTNVSDTVYKFIVKNSTDVNIGFGIVGGEATIEAFNDAINAATPLRIYASKLSMGLNGNVLINTTTDAGYKLDVNGTGRFLSGSSSTIGLIVGGAGGAGSTRQGQLRFGDAGSVYKIQGGEDYSAFNFMIGSGTPLTITSGGNVGIGTTAPAHKLSIKGASNYDGVISVDNSTTTGGGAFLIRQNGVTSGFIGVVGSALGNSDRNLAHYGELGIGHRFFVNDGTTSLFLNSGGNVLIGTTTDNGAKLQVSGSATIGGNLTISSGNNLNVVTGDIHFQSNAGYGILSPNANRLVSIQNGAFGVSGAATFSSDVTAARYYNPSGPYGTSQANARNHFTQFNAGNATLAGGWIAGAFGDALGNRIVIGQYAGVAVIAGHNGNLDNWASMALATGGGNVMVGTTTDSGDKLRVAGTTFTNEIKTFLPEADSVSTPWRFGTASIATIIPNRRLRVNVGGVEYYIGAVEV
jgi:hypothetical protein